LPEVSGSKSLARKLERQGQSLCIETAKETSDIVCDKIKVAQMLMNLIEGMSSAIDRGANSPDIHHG